MTMLTRSDNKMDTVDHQKDLQKAVKCISFVGEVCRSDQRMHLHASSRKDEEDKERWIRKVMRGECNYVGVNEIKNVVVEDEPDPCVDHKFPIFGYIQNLEACC